MRRRSYRYRMPAFAFLSSLCLCLIGCREKPVPPAAETEIAAEETESGMDYENAKRVLSLACSGSGPGEQLVRSFWEESDHTIYINYYNSGSLGNDEEVVASVQAGTIDIYYGTTSGAASLIPELSLLDIPYEFSSLEECNAMLTGELFDWFQQYYQQQGLQLLAWGACGYREITSNRKIQSPADLVGLKIRTMDNVYHQTYWQALGADVRVMDYNELFYALQQGIVDAQENPTGAIISAGIDQMQQYILLTNHLPFIYTRVMNLELYNSLTEEEQELLETFLQDDLERNVVNPEESVATIQEKTDMEILTPSTYLLAHLKEKNQVVIDKLKENLGKDLVNEYLKLVE